MKTKQIFLAGAFALASTAAMTAQAHAKLESSEPKAGSTLGSAPKVVRLRFNETLEAAFSNVKLSDAANGQVALPKVELDKADGKTMIATLPPLHPGEYHVQWSAMTHDGHKAKGEFTFSVK
ncbi:MAG: copper homeostasis periplasmic binding protein CopC [Massilia sp.]